MNTWLRSRTTSFHFIILLNLWLSCVTLALPYNKTLWFGNDIKARQCFLRSAAHFSMRRSLMFKKQSDHFLLLVIFDPIKQVSIIKYAYEKLGHCGAYGVFYHLWDCFFWPQIYQDIKHHVASCHERQLWCTKRVEVSPTIRTPVALFLKVYVDLMLMPNIHGYWYIVAARDDLCHVAEERALKKASSKHMSRFFWEQIICRYGHIAKVITNNGSEVAKAFQKLLKCYRILQIRISLYNKYTNGVVEQGHFTIWKSILKDCTGRIEEWPNHVHLAFFANRVITQRVTGFSPFYLLHGVDSVLSFDLTEATFMITGYWAELMSAELLSLRMRQLDKQPADIKRAAKAIKCSRLAFKEQFEKRFCYWLKVIQNGYHESYLYYLATSFQYSDLTYLVYICPRNEPLSFKKKIIHDDSPDNLYHNF